MVSLSKSSALLRRRTLTAVLGTAAFIMFVPAIAAAQCIATVGGDGTAQFTLWAGRQINAGTVSVTVNQTALRVTFNPIDGWQLLEAHVWIGSSLDELPENKAGNPMPGRFPFGAVNLTGDSYTVAIPLANPAINFACPSDDTIYYLAAHASVQRRNADGSYQQETGWSEGSRITAQGNWATFSTITLSCRCGVWHDGVASCHTAFGYYAQANVSFLTLGFQRWGWTNGPLGPGRYVFDLYAAAGQSDITKGYLAGFVTVDYDGTIASVTYTTQPGWWLTETHLYVGNTPLPTVKQGAKLVSTVSPGQFPYQHSLDHATSDTFTAAVTGPIYIIAHAVACEIEND